MEEIRISQGQIWEVMKSFLTSGEGNEFDRPVQIKKGEKIEIRYPYEWHFRTEDNHYFHATSKVIMGNCKLFGVILEQVRFSNRANLKQILEIHAYKEHRN